MHVDVGGTSARGDGDRYAIRAAAPRPEDSAIRLFQGFKEDENDQREEG